MHRLVSTLALAALALIGLGSPAHAEPAPDSPQDRASTKPEVVSLHGFRLGWIYVNTPAAAAATADAYGQTIDPNHALIGYELNQRVDGGSWLNLLFVENFALTSFNQSVLRPQASFLLGFDVERLVEAGVGINVSPFDPNQTPWHMVGAIGMTPMVGNLNVPIHVTFIPDVYDAWRLGLTMGVNWGERQG